MHPNINHQRTRQGVLLALAAYTMWGIAPIYFKAIEQVPALEILSHRVFWSFGLIFILILASHRMSHIRALIKNKKQLLLLSIATTLIGTNWFLYIWATTHDFILDASLGYFINPLLNVAIGMLFFQERLRRLQLIAVALAFLGVLIQLIAFGSIPWIALALAGSFATYGAIRKRLPIDSLSGLWLEVSLMLPVMLIYFTFFAQSDAKNMFENTWLLNTLLVSAGIVTTLPLLCFTAAAQRLRYSTLGFFQYIGPSIMFLIAIFMYQEPLATDRLFTFVVIWVALAIYSFDALLTVKKNRKKRLLKTLTQGR